jgi:hypothetical protein
MVTLALFVATVVGALCLLHLYWGLGGRWGHTAALPERDHAPALEPGAVATLLVAALLAMAALVVLGRVGIGPLAGIGRLTRITAWAVAVAFLLRAVGDFRLVGLFRRVRDTRFAKLDRLLYTPTSLALGIAAAIIAAG